MYQSFVLLPTLVQNSVESKWPASCEKGQSDILKSLIKCPSISHSRKICCFNGFSCLLDMTCLEELRIMQFSSYYQDYGPINLGHIDICTYERLIYSILHPKVAIFAFFGCLSSGCMHLAHWYDNNRGSYTTFYPVDTCRRP